MAFNRYCMSSRRGGRVELTLSLNRNEINYLVFHQDLKTHFGSYFKLSRYYTLMTYKW